MMTRTSTVVDPLLRLRLSIHGFAQRDELGLEARGMSASGMKTPAGGPSCEPNHAPEPRCADMTEKINSGVIFQAVLIDGFANFHAFLCPVPPTSNPQFSDPRSWLCV